MQDKENLTQAYYFFCCHVFSGNIYIFTLYKCNTEMGIAETYSIALYQFIFSDFHSSTSSAKVLGNVLTSDEDKLKFLLLVIYLSKKNV